MEVRERKLRSVVNWQSAFKRQRTNSWLIGSPAVAVFLRLFTAVIFYFTFAIV
jgi:hypothetical protein